jgi:hypothetical protein
MDTQFVKAPDGEMRPRIAAAKLVEGGGYVLDVISTTYNELWTFSYGSSLRTRGGSSLTTQERLVH